MGKHEGHGMDGVTQRKWKGWDYGKGIQWMGKDKVNRTDGKTLKESN